MDERAEELADQARAAGNDGNYAEALRLFQAALAAERECPPVCEKVETYLLSCIGYAAQRCDQLGIARKSYERTVRIQRRIADPDSRALAATLHRLGDTHIQRGEPGIARVYLTESADIFLRLREFEDAIHILYDLAVFARDADDPEEACALFHDALALARQTDDYSYQVWTLCGLARLAHSQQASESAQWYLEEARCVALECRTPDIVRLWVVIARAAQKIKQRKAAGEAWETAVGLARERDDLVERAEALYHLGFHQNKTGDNDAARRSLEEALLLQRQVASETAYRSLWMLGHVALDTRQYGEAAQRYQEALRSLPTSHDPETGFNLLLLYARSLFSCLRLGEATVLYSVLQRASPTVKSDVAQIQTADIGRAQPFLRWLFWRNWRRGQKLSLAEAVAFAAALPVTKKSVTPALPPPADSAKSAPYG